MTTKMRSEIAEQPAALRATLDSLLPRIDEVRAVGERTRQLLFIARGTSDNAAVYGRYLVESHAGRLAALAAPSIATTYKRKLDLDGVLAVAISQSGRTEEIVETLTWAKDCGAATVGITNGGPDSPLAQAADVALCTEAGEEKAVPATKTYTTQLAALAVLALGLGADVDVAELRRVPEAVEKLIAEPGEVAAVVEGLLDKPGVVVSGRGLAFSTALETALKLKEACYLHAMGLSYADLLHGPIAVVDADTPALLVAAENSPTLSGTVALARAGTAALNGPDLPEWVAPMGLIIPGQLLTEALARRLGIDPDAPRGLNKVTQTD
ncbi:SIS domain-containing protein [Nonomuraea turkmeniaca]|uniref:SIS domain-containing protein n=1 Tax=Nonomuraea turkmeniaca TaxID=103838 RepID=A0A5S4F352_9ACTN|nr:SIS domain-containing protein [Nonomuraea turkmeniaca]TMR10453.1 SIS domain-containing protein [Nonomuraea turkmeniaca]